MFNGLSHPGAPNYGYFSLCFLFSNIFVVNMKTGNKRTTLYLFMGEHYLGESGSPLDRRRHWNSGAGT